MKLALWNLTAAVAALSLITLAFAPTPAGAQSEPMRFGMNLSSLEAQTQAGVKPDMGMMWIGPWTLSSGWGGPDGELRRAYAAGVTPVIQFYYWGDDISISCIENGCDSGLHGARKDKAGWNELARQLAQHLNTEMKGRQVIIIVETEFNKNDVYNYEPLDGYLAEKATYFRNNYAGSEVVMGFGNWGREHWGTWDRAVAASDATGVQGMRGSTRNNEASYLSLAQATYDGAKALRDRFHKPIYITDIALSSYPEPEYLKLQADALQPFFGRLADFKALGVKGMLYRSLKDSPNMDLKNYFGQAERHWGLMWAYNSTHKPSMAVWINGVQKERGAPVSSSATPPPPPPHFPASFEIKAPNEWWQEVYIDLPFGYSLDRVSVRINDGSWKAMSKSSWGAWTSSYNAKAGSKVEFLATATNGATSQSQPFTWMNGETRKDSVSSTTTTPTTSSSTPTSSSAPTTSSAAPTTSSATPTTSSAAPAPSTFAPTFEIKAPGEWWQEVYLRNTNGHAIQGVDLRINGGAWKTMSKSSWGAWTTSQQAKAGSKVEFLATTTGGLKAQSEPFTWMNGELTKGTAGATPTSSPSPTTSSPTPTTTTSSPSPTTSSPTPTTTSASPSPTTSAAPAPVAVPVLSLAMQREAESFSVKTIGTGRGDSAASGGRSWLMNQNGYLSQSFQAAEGSHRILVRAVGITSNSELPNLQILVDGKVVHEARVASGSYQVIATEVPLTQGSHELRIAYTNDASGILANRDLVVDWAAVQLVVLVEAESFASKSTGVRESEATASGGARWNLWSTGSMSQDVSMPTAGNYEWTVRARGTALNGVYANMVIKIDGVKVLETPAAAEWKTYVVRSTALPAGTHSITIEFTNDAFNSKQDRNLYVDKLEVARAV